MNAITHPETLQRHSLAKHLQEKVDKLLATKHKLETELRCIRKLCAEEFSEDPRNTTLDCVSRTLLMYRTTSDNDTQGD